MKRQKTLNTITIVLRRQTYLNPMLEFSGINGFELSYLKQGEDGYTTIIFVDKDPQNLDTERGYHIELLATFFNTL